MSIKENDNFYEWAKEIKRRWTFFTIVIFLSAIIILIYLIR